MGFLYLCLFNPQLSRWMLICTGGIQKKGSGSSPNVLIVQGEWLAWKLKCVMVNVLCSSAKRELYEFILQFMIDYRLSILGDLFW